MGSNSLANKKRFKMPNTYVLISIFIVIAAICTYILPAGQYDLIKNAATGRMVVDPNSFHYVDSNPASFMDVFLSIPLGMKQGATIIFLIFIIGGAFQVIDDTGALSVSISALVDKFGDKPFLVIPIVMAIMSVLGALGIVVVASIAFIPLGAFMAKKLKLDPVVAVAIMYIGAYSGFTTSPFCPATLQLAQNIAGLEPLSGIGLRVIVWAIVTVVAIAYTLRYSRKLQKNIDNSVLDEIVWSDGYEAEQGKFTLQTGLILADVVVVFSIYTYGALNWGWGNNHMAAIMLIAAVICAIIARMNPNDVATSFVKGCKNITYGTLIIGFATAISYILTQGNIIHTIIHGLSLPLLVLPTVLSSVFMFLINLVFNFFVPSGSGQAAIVMPLMAPLADIVGLTRQVSVLAYQWGDGFSNTIIPTSGVLMAVLAVAKVPYEKWLKFMLPLFCWWTVIGAVAIALATMLGYN
ncbi:MAG: YfcC family protein [Pleomorphochaeta sp.]